MNLLRGNPNGCPCGLESCPMANREIGGRTTDDLESDGGPHMEDVNVNMQSTIADARGDEQPIIQAFEKKREKSTDFMKNFLGNETETSKNPDPLLNHDNGESTETTFEGNENSNSHQGHETNTPNKSAKPVQKDRENKTSEIYENVFIDPDNPRGTTLGISSVERTNTAGHSKNESTSTSTSSGQTDFAYSLLQVLTGGRTRKHSNMSPNVPRSQKDDAAIDAINSSAKPRNEQSDSSKSPTEELPGNMQHSSSTPSELMQTLNSANSTSKTKSRIKQSDASLPDQLTRTLRLFTEDSDSAKGKGDSNWTIKDIMEEKLSTVNEEGDDFGMFDTMSSLTSGSGGKVFLDQYDRGLRMMATKGGKRFLLFVLR